MVQSCKCVVLIAVVFLLTACARVGSESWCRKMQETPKQEWTINQVSDYTESCLFK
ncbi:MAG: DUF3012 domain-containing protein [Gammaproteobacteria bacterium]|nr:DUF3012 domain-containing protein [Gammaproteobacteria bacterium]